MDKTYNINLKIGQKMENVVFKFVNEHLYMHIILIIVFVSSMLGAMLIDLITGVSKASQRGEARTSAGYKMTVAKAHKYFSPFIALVFIDIIACVVVPLPVFSMLWSAYCVFCEFKSIREKSWEKAELRKAERTMNVIIDNKDDIAKIAAEILFKTQKEEEEK